MPGEHWVLRGDLVLVQAVNAKVAEMPNIRELLLNMLARQSFRLGEFKLSSGLASDYYIDCRTTTLDAEGIRLAGRVFLELIQNKKWKPRAIGGLTLGADPIVAAVALLTSQSVQTRAPARPKPVDVTEFLIHGFLVRKQDKAHGTGQRIEGFREKGARVVIVDDVCTTGSSTIQAIEAAREFGFEIGGVACLVEREEAAGRAAVEKAAAPAEFVSIFKASDIRAAHSSLKP
jgi:orotate phosphoribosyltransferase